VIIQHANINQPIANDPPPIPKNMNITFLVFYTNFSLSDAKVSVKFPHNNAKEGMAAPIINAAIDPTIMSIMSILSANLNNSTNGIVGALFL
jgi:hypothetical protein